MTPRELGRYQLIAEQARDGISVTYSARDRRLRRDVALRVLVPGTADQSDAAARRSQFEQETRAQAVLSHPALPALLDLAQVEDRLCAVYEPVHGQSLREILDLGGPLPERRALAIAAQVASALGAAHDAGVCHGGFSAESVRLAPTGRVTVLGVGSRLPDDPQEAAELRQADCDAVVRLLAAILRGPQAPAPAGPANAVLTELLRRDRVPSGAVTCCGELAAVLASVGETRTRPAVQRDSESSLGRPRTPAAAALAAASVLALAALLVPHAAWMGVLSSAAALSTLALGERARAYALAASGLLAAMAGMLA